MPSPGPSCRSRNEAGPGGTVAASPHPPVLVSPRRPPQLGDYEQQRATFRWEAAAAWLDGLPGGGLNIAHEAVDRHAAGELADVTAVRFLGAGDPAHGTAGAASGEAVIGELTYRELGDRTGRFAAVLTSLGVGPGEVVCTLLSRALELYVTALGTVKAGRVYCPLFPAFGPEPVCERQRLGSARVLVTTAEAYRRKVAEHRAGLPALTHVLIVGDGPAPEGTARFEDLLAAHPRPVPCAATRPEDPALLHFTSGTTGRPKGAVHVHRAVLAHHVTSRFALDLQRGDVFWCTADPGWVTGTSYGIIGPLTRGVTVVTDAAEFDARRWYRVLAGQRVTVWYTAPTAIRMLMRHGGLPVHEYDLSALRHVVSVGEPLNPEGVLWGLEALNLPIHDTWWQTETGAIMISNYPGMAVRPGSMGRPIPGVEASVLRRGPDGRAAVRVGAVAECSPGEEGELALRPGWPSMFRAYLHDPERYAAAFAGGWYLTGDIARADADGYFWFVGRADDVIKTAGHLVGPFEVESVLMEHPAVVEAGVIGTPDPVAGEVVKAFVTVRDG